MFGETEEFRERIINREPVNFTLEKLFHFKLCIFICIIYLAVQRGRVFLRATCVDDVC